MRKKILIIIIMILLFILSVVIYDFCKPKTYISIHNDGVYFNMSPKKLIKIKGEPLEVSNNSETTWDYYDFSETIYGYNARTTYVFYKSPFKVKLFQADYLIENLDFTHAKKLFNKVYNNMVNYYSQDQDYFDSGIESNEKDYLSVNLGTDNGAAGIICHMEYKDNTLSINIINQQ